MNNLCQVIPKKILGWIVTDKDQPFDRSTLFKHIDGEAELYLSYDFKNVWVRKYSGPEDNEIILDLYDMGSSTDAFGIFSCERENKEAGIGQGSEYGEGLLRFWKDRFFVSILAVSDPENAEPVIMELGKIIARTSKPTGAAPEILKYLPQKNLEKDSIRYFHTDIVLNNYYYIADRNILYLNHTTDCLLAQYKINIHYHTMLLMVFYKTKKQANIAYENFVKIYMPEAKNGGIAQMENKRWTQAGIDNNLLIIVFEAPDKNRASELFSSVKINQK